MKYTINVEYEIGDTVYSKTDLEQKPGILLGYECTNLGVSYICVFDSVTSTYNQLELSSIKTIY